MGGAGGERPTPPEDRRQPVRSSRRGPPRGPVGSAPPEGRAVRSETLDPSRWRRASRLPPYVFAEVAGWRAEALAAGRTVFDFSLGNPDGEPPEAVVRALREAARPGQFRYPQANGGRELREAMMELRGAAEAPPAAARGGGSRAAPSDELRGGSSRAKIPRRADEDEARRGCGGSRAPLLKDRREPLRTSRRGPAAWPRRAPAPRRARGEVRDDP